MQQDILALYRLYGANTREQPEPKSKRYAYNLETQESIKTVNQFMMVNFGICGLFPTGKPRWKVQHWRDPYSYDTWEGVAILVNSPQDFFKVKLRFG